MLALCFLFIYFLFVCFKSYGGASSSLSTPDKTLTCVGLQVLRSHHDDEANGTLVAEHLVGPAPD